MPPRPHRRREAPVAILLVLLFGCASSAPPEVLARSTRWETVVDLPAPTLDGPVSLEAAIADRRSRRTFGASDIPLAEVGQILWAGQGLTDAEGRRAAPSAGGRYPIELYVVTAGSVAHYLPEGHRLEQRPDRSTLDRLGPLAFGQEFVSDALVVVVIAAVPGRTEVEYGAVAESLVDREAGHVAQNILLQATVLGRASVPVGGFDPAAVATELALPPGHDVRYLIPIG